VRGSIEVICGPMFSGKTEELIRRTTRARIAKQDVLIFKHSSDDRYGSIDKVWSHSGFSQACMPMSTVSDLHKFLSGYTGDPKVIAIEEVQFFDPEIVLTIKRLKDQDKKIIVAGLDMDWMGLPFTITGKLMAMADKVDKLTAVCLECGEDATHSYKKNKSGERIEVGEKDLYEARCYKHWR